MGRRKTTNKTSRKKANVKKIVEGMTDKKEALKTIKAILKGKKKGDRGYAKLTTRKKKLEAEIKEA